LFTLKLVYPVAQLRVGRFPRADGDDRFGDAVEQANGFGDLWLAADRLRRFGRIHDQGRVNRVGRSSGDGGYPPHHLNRVLQDIRRAGRSGELDDGATRQAPERIGHGVQGSAPGDAKHVTFDDDLTQQAGADGAQVVALESRRLVGGDDDDGMVQAKRAAQAIRQVWLESGRQANLDVHEAGFACARQGASNAEAGDTKFLGDLLFGAIFEVVAAGDGRRLDG